MSLQGGSITVLQHPSTQVDALDSNYTGCNPSTSVLPKGDKKTSECRAIETPIVFERDFQVPLQDGIKLRADVFRPEGEAKTPVLMAWSPYGKPSAGFFSLGLIPGRVGVKKGALSGYEKFEPPDPAEWVGKGYAMVHIDSRGSFDSEGDIRWFGTAEGRDGYDAIEEIAKLSWCNQRSEVLTRYVSERKEKRKE